MRASGVGPVVETRRRNRHRKLVQAVAFFIQFIALDDDVLAFRVVHGDRLDRLGQGFFPKLVHLVGAVAAHAEKIDLRISRQSANHHRHIVLPSLGVGDVFKQPCFAFFFRQAAVLPANQRMELRVFVDESRDASQQAMLFEIFQMLMQIEIRHTVNLSYASIRQFRNNIGSKLKRQPGDRFHC